MPRGRGYSSSRGGGYRGSSGGRGGSYGGDRYGGSYSNSYDSRKYSSGDRFSSSRGSGGDYRSSYRPDSSYSRDSGHRSPDRKRMRTEAPSHHRDSYGSSYGGRYESSGGPSPYQDSRRSYSGDRSFSRKQDFRRPSGPPRGSYRGRISSRGGRGKLGRDRAMRGPIRRLADSYGVRKRAIGMRRDYGRSFKITRLRSSVIARSKIRKRASSPKDDSDEEKTKEKKDKDEDKDDAENKEDDEKSPKKEKTGSGKEDSGDESDEKKKDFIKLVCPHCNLKSPTFRSYLRHLGGKGHLIAMRKIAMKHKSILSQMRQAQRNTQYEIEKTSDDLSPKTNFCPLCKLNYKQRRAVHQATESHKNMKKFLLPYCMTCNINFKSPMSYESHICSIAHIKRKQRSAGSDASGDEDNLEEFTTIDSVGDVDGEGDGKEADAETSDGAGTVTVKKEPVNVGIEQIKKIEAHYCELCKMYLPRVEEEELPKVLARHCKLRVHMHRYVLLKEREELAKKAEKLQRKENADKEKKKDGEVSVKKEKVDQDADTSATDANDSTASKEAGKQQDDDKLWADVDKDLGDILAEAEEEENVAGKTSDEDEEEEGHAAGHRYDRFKLSEEKNEDDKDGDKKAEAAEGKEENQKEEIEL